MKASKIFSIALVTLLLHGCGGMSIVKKPQIDSVKKVAIISVYANSSIQEDGYRGGLTALASAISKKMKKKTLQYGGTRLVEFGLEAFTSEFKKVNGWQLSDHKSLINNPAYKIFKENYKKGLEEQRHAMAQKIDEMLYKTVPGMLDYRLTGGGDKEIVQSLKKLCADLQVDSVVVIEMNLSYKASLGIAKIGGLGSTGTAKMSVSSSVRMVNKNGEFAINTNNAKDTPKSLSDETTGIVLGNIVYSDKVEAMYKDAISKNAAYFGKEIRKNL